MAKNNAPPHGDRVDGDRSACSTPTHFYYAKSIMLFFEYLAESRGWTGGVHFRALLIWWIESLNIAGSL